MSTVLDITFHDVDEVAAVMRATFRTHPVLVLRQLLTGAGRESYARPFALARVMTVSTQRCGPPFSMHMQLVVRLDELEPITIMSSHKKWERGSHHDGPHQVIVDDTITPSVVIEPYRIRHDDMYAKDYRWMFVRL